MNKTKAVPTENKEVKENVLTNEQLEKLKKNLSPEDLKRYEALKSIIKSSNSPEEIKEKVSELTDDQLSCAAGGVEPSSTDAKGQIMKSVSSTMFGFSSGLLAVMIYNLCKSVRFIKVKKNPEKTNNLNQTKDIKK